MISDCSAKKIFLNSSTLDFSCSLYIIPMKTISTEELAVMCIQDLTHTIIDSKAAFAAEVGLDFDKVMFTLDKAFFVKGDESREMDYDKVIAIIQSTYQ